MPVVRNPQFNFREGFCWNLINGTRSFNDLKFRISSRGVNDVGGMSLHSMLGCIPNYYIVCLCNADFMSRYSEAYINFTVNFQINDARLLPIIVPNAEQLNIFKLIYETAFDLQKQLISANEFSDKIESKLKLLQIELNKQVDILYGI